MKIVFPQPAAWMPRVMAGLLILNVVLALAEAENPAAPKTPGGDYTVLTKVPSKARARPNPLESDPNAVTAGRKLFEQHCSECHGRAAAGGKRGPNLRVAAVQEAPPGALFYVLTNGVVRRGMPDWSKLPEPERWQIVSFLESLRESPGR